MFCSNCGKEVSGKFCSYCGAPLESSEKPEQAENDAPKEADITSEKKAKKKGFWSRSFELMNYANQLKAQDVVRCPRCGSTQISAVKKGFGIGKATVGGMVAGPVGLLAGGIGAKKMERVCLKCGHKF